MLRGPFPDDTSVMVWGGVAVYGRGNALTIEWYGNCFTPG